MAKYSVALDLPENLVLEIGRVALHFSYLESVVDRIIFDLMGVEQKKGRIAISSGQDLASRISALKRLLKVDHPSLEEQGTKLANRIAKKAEDRNAMLHGVWYWDPEKELHVLQRVTGAGRGSVSRVIDPEGDPMTAGSAANLVAEIKKLSQTAVEFRENLRAGIAASSGSELAEPRLTYTVSAGTAFVQSKPAITPGKT